MNPTPLARVIETVNNQLTLLHVCVLITQLGAHVPSALLTPPNAIQVLLSLGTSTHKTFLMMWRVSSASQITLGCWSMPQNFAHCLSRCDGDKRGSYIHLPIPIGNGRLC